MSGFFRTNAIICEQTFSALLIFVSAAHVALFSKNMSGALVCAHFLKDERRSR